MRKIKKNDAVVLLAGRDRGKTGKVLSVLQDGTRVTVEKCNMVKRHTKPTQQYRTGGIIEKEAPIHVSNVALAGSDGKPARVGFQVRDGAPKVRISRKSDQVFE